MQNCYIYEILIENTFEVIQLQHGIIGIRDFRDLAWIFHPNKEFLLLQRQQDLPTELLEQHDGKNQASS